VATDGRIRSPLLLRIETAVSQDRCSSSIPQARHRLRGVPALLAEQKNRY
jgi:hypothetical protein